jgi:hypothetical protein
MLNGITVFGDGISDNANGIRNIAEGTGSCVDGTRNVVYASRFCVDGGIGNLPDGTRFLMLGTRKDVLQACRRQHLRSRLLSWVASCRPRVLCSLLCLCACVVCLPCGDVVLSVKEGSTRVAK